MFFIFYFSHSALSAVYTLSLHDALPIFRFLHERSMYGYEICQAVEEKSQGRHSLKYGAVYPLLRELEKNEVIKGEWEASTDRKSTRLNSSHLGISYAVFCLKKKNKTKSK